MLNQEILYPTSTSIRNLPINLNPQDLELFDHELKRIIPATTLLYLKDITVNPDGLLVCGSEILPQSFPSPRFMDSWKGIRGKLKLWFKNFLSSHRSIDREVFWVTDTWSQGYFHWLTDALPRLFMIQEKLENATLLLPGTYQKQEFITSSLKPFSIQAIEFVHETFHCKDFKIPTHTAPTGNYNESIIRGLRSLYTSFYQHECSDLSYSKVYVSRGRAKKRKIANEAECIAVLEEYGFKTIYFEDYSFEQQVKIALNAQYLVSNHGAGLTNMLFMKPGSSVLELRRTRAARRNCYFALSSALYLKYFYQLCSSENFNEDTHTANLIVDCHLLRENIERMLTRAIV
ncbi:glycosyltransferase family 61 protein [Egbenema bharatensis]|uniref:glycosyltransferase family 61 protein n=1 Tax=Egbenema bharatensis TaxID=3463334 RepID=UPI003A89988C